MDSIKTLMDKNQYELVIKLTETTVDVDSIFYRISALLALGRGEDALKCLLDNRRLLQTRLAFLIKVHIDLLCLLSRYDEAFEAYDYYKNLPYESQEVEELLKSLPNKIREEEKNEYSRKQISEEDIIKKLKSDDRLDVLQGLDLIAHSSSNILIEQIKPILLNHPQQTIRSFALMVLVEKKINKDFKFLSHKGEIIVNPSTLKSPFNDKFIEISKKLTNEFRNPSLSDNAISILSNYLIHLYPDECDIEDDYVIGALYFVSSKTLQSTPNEDVEEYSLKHGLDAKRLQSYIDKLSYIL